MKYDKADVIVCFSKDHQYQNLLTLLLAGFDIDKCRLVENKNTASKGIVFEDPEYLVMAKLIL